MHTVLWIAIGILVGWSARIMTRQRSYGLLGDLLIGLLGGLVGGSLFRLVGITSPTDLLAEAAVALFGAVLLLGAARMFRRVYRGAQKVVASAPAAALLAAGDLDAHLRRLGDAERRVLDRLLRRQPQVRDTNTQFEQELTFGQRVADRVASFGGSWTFIGLFFAVLLAWMALNSELRRPFDPYPFILLNLVLSCLAALQAPVIMMSQNRQAAKDRLDARNDYEVNLRAELAIMELHAKLDEARERQWARILELQEKQLQLVERIEQRGD
jgi:uncharacterized membrane protein/uncharacterized membrane protein YeaQ/YmgE (transglycosylase-associated protein family)